jgi:hypothetical protein
MNHVMLDLETFGTKPGSVIRSIGAVMFDPFTGSTGSEFYRNVDKQSCIDAGLTVDASTERWWSQQSKEAQDSLLVDPKPLAEVVRDFNKWFIVNSGAQVWSQGSNFDGVLWEFACAAVKQRVPWKFYDTRDTRTVYDIFGLNSSSVSRAGTYHNALDDAKHQARCVAVAVGIGRPAKHESKCAAPDEAMELM